MSPREHTDRALIAVDIGNSRMKLGRFAWRQTAGRGGPLPEPVSTAVLPIDNHTGAFDAERFAAWCDEHVRGESAWLVGSVHRGAADRLTAAVGDWAKRLDVESVIRRLTYRDVPLPIQVDEPPAVGIDRLLGAAAADRLREPDKPAIVVDLGTAITVDLLTANGAFAGGAILPGIAMGARALADQTDALPHVSVDGWQKSPVALGKSTGAAIESGLYWGAVGALRELIGRLSAGLPQRPVVFVTGGASAQMAEQLEGDEPVRYVPHLVLSGIALVAEAGR